MTQTKVNQTAQKLETNFRTKAGNGTQNGAIFPKGTAVPKVDLSSSNELVAKQPTSLIFKGYSNGEGMAYFLYTNHGKHNGKRGGKRGKRVTTGLSSKAKRKIRLASHLFTNWNKKNRNQYGGASTFLTLTFRRIVPDDKTAKKLLDTFLQRMRRRYKDFCYIWVAEHQKGKLIDGKKSYRMLHGAALHFHILTPFYFDKQEINRAWNEVVKDWAIKTAKITKAQGKVWKREIALEPSKTKYLLRPNLIGVYNATRYMAKYISKDGAGIQGNNWGYSENLSKHFEPTHMESIEEVNIQLINKAMQVAGRSKMLFQFRDFKDNLCLWTKDIKRLQRRLSELYEGEMKRAKECNQYKEVDGVIYKNDPVSYRCDRGRIYTQDIWIPLPAC